MSRLIDPEKLTCYKNALANSRFANYVVLTEIAETWLTRHLQGLTARKLGQLMHEHVQGGGEIDQQKETRPEWTDHDYHYDLRMIIAGRKVYIETRLIYDDPLDPDDPTVWVVNIHDA